MISLIVSSPSKTRRKEYIQKYCKGLSINAFDITIIQKNIGPKQNKSSIGIEEIKYMQKKLFLKPLRSPTKAVVIEDAHLLTNEAQNAMLKVLEEPPKHTIILLSSESKEPLLPTIISRCKIIDLGQKEQKLNVDQTKELTDFIENLPKMPVGEKFKKAEQLAKDKEKAITWTGNIILVMREELLKKYSSKSRASTPMSADLLQTLKSFQSLRVLLKTTNTNPRFAIENTLLNLI